MVIVADLELHVVSGAGALAVDDGQRDEELVPATWCNLMTALRRGDDSRISQSSYQFYKPNTSQPFILYELWPCPSFCMSCDPTLHSV